MSIADKITRLQTAKSGIASAITAKGGTVGASDGFEDFAADIASIPSGGGGFNPLLYANDIGSLFNQRNLPDNSSISFGPNVKKDAISIFNGTTCDHLTVSFETQQTTAMYMFRDAKIKELTLLADLSKATSFLYFIYGYTTIEKVYGTPIDTSSSTSNNSLYSVNYHSANDKLTYIRFAPNTMKINSTVNSSYLDDGSIESLANALNEDATGQALTLSADVKNKLSEMLGTVTMDSTNTYHVFTLNQSGSANLEDFITNTKGWTIA